MGLSLGPEFMPSLCLKHSRFSFLFYSSPLITKENILVKLSRFHEIDFKFSSFWLKPCSICEHKCGTLI